MFLCFLPVIARGAPPIDIVFYNYEINRLPTDWKARDVHSAGKVYSVQIEMGKRFIHADSKGTKDQIGFEAKWPLREFPLLQWQWRAVQFPTGSFEREKSKNDSVLGIYVIFGTFYPFIKTIKYIWSDTLPVGSIFTSPYSSTTRMVVVRSGRAQQGTWLTERRDVLADYFQIYGDSDKNPVASGIGLLTDSDDTNSHSIGDYADFRTPPPSVVKATAP
ncbi:MAG: DUF3047 domain-containing protein [Deltaproteobacteria bacterium]|nr:DUF3047 domain-containing protein [Deltaproteobacteria bacterium]